jgi:UDP-N-acetylglucosamine 2-epimerase (non-hydrolysing)
MGDNLRVLRDFVQKRKDVTLFFPVHPNPNVKFAANELLAGVERIHLLEPLDYIDFISLMKASWLIVSDSGGVQEEAPSLGKPLLVLRENTERPEAIHSGIAKLVGGSPNRLKMMLEENYAIDTWTRSVEEIANPFGDGTAAKKIVKLIDNKMSLGARR